MRHSRRRSPFQNFNLGAINWFITRLGKCLTQGERDDISPDILEPLSVIQQFCALLDKLHSKGIIHGDIKPSNLVIDTANNLRFVDFAEAVLESDPPLRRASTTHYVSPSSMKARSPLTREDDMYAGVTIWHIYTGHLPFENIDEDDLDFLIADGLRPDLSIIDDEAVRALICKYLQAGEPHACYLLLVLEGHRSAWHVRVPTFGDSNLRHIMPARPIRLYKY